jgi:hypothetical protein
MYLMTGEFPRPPGEVQSMRSKSCFAAAVEDAMVQARQEPGPETMLVNSRTVPPEARHPGVGIQALETAGALAQAIGENRKKDPIPIDTPGFGPAGREADCGLAQSLSSRSDLDTLSSSMKAADVSSMVDRFEIFRPQRLLFAGMDEPSRPARFSTRLRAPGNRFRSSQRSAHSRGSGSRHVGPAGGAASRRASEPGRLGGLGSPMQKSERLCTPRQCPK